MKKFINAIAVIIVFVALTIPAISYYAIENYQIENVLNVQNGEYSNVSYINIQTNDMDDYDFMASSVIDYNETENDTYLRKTGGVSHGCFYNAVTTINNTNYINNINYSKLSGGVTPATDLIFQLDIIIENFTKLEYIKLNSTDNQHGNIYLVWYDGANEILIPFHQLDDGNYILINTLSVQLQMYGYEDLWLYLIYLNVDDTENTWEVKISSYEKSNDIIISNPMEIYGLSLWVSIAVLVSVILFNTDTFDIKIDRKRK